MISRYLFLSLCDCFQFVIGDDVKEIFDPFHNYFTNHSTHSLLV